LSVLAVLSGKGGTGKTTMAVNLARTAGRAVYLDCDVEEPNGHLFLRPEVSEIRPITVGYPEIRQDLCTRCGACARFCRFHAFLSAPAMTLTLPELCHDCGGCRMVCPAGAIEYRQRETGRVSRGTSGDLKVLTGTLDVGELSGVPLIRALRAEPSEGELCLADCPPGTACAAAAAVEGADLALIVAEDTPFGLSDMTMAVEMLENRNIPAVAVINKAGSGGGVREFCESRGLPVLGELPFAREIASVSARGELLVEALPEMARWFRELLSRLEERLAMQAEERLS